MGSRLKRICGPPGEIGLATVAKDEQPGQLYLHHGQIDAPILVKIAGHQAGCPWNVFKIPAPRETSFSIPKIKGQIGGTRIGGHPIQFSIVVEIRNLDPNRPDPDRKVVIGKGTPFAISHQDADMLRARCRNGQVGLAVLVEIARGHMMGKNSNFQAPFPFSLWLMRHQGLGKKKSHHQDKNRFHKTAL